RALRKDLKQVGNGFRIVLADFTSRDRRKSDQVDASSVRRSIVFDLRGKIRKRCQNAFVNTNQASVPLAGFSPGQRINQATISKRKRVTGKDHRILIGDAERLQSNVFGTLRGRIEHGILTQRPCFLSRWRCRMVTKRSAVCLKTCLSLPILLNTVPLCLPVWQAISLGPAAMRPKRTEILATEQAEARVEGSVGDDRGRIDATAPRNFDAKTFGVRSRRQYGCA